METNHVNAIRIAVAALVTTFITTTAQAIVIMPMGDSITVGTVDENDYGLGGYRAYLQDLLIANGASFEFAGTSTLRSDGTPLPNTTPGGNVFDKRHQGYSGAWTHHLHNNVSTDQPFEQFQPDVVLLMIGTNNWTSATQFTNVNHNRADWHDIDIGWITVETRSLLNYIYANAPGVHVIISTIVPAEEILENEYGTWDRNIFVSNYNDALIQYVNDGLANVNLNGGTYSLLNMTEAAGLTFDDLADGIHPNNTGYEKMAGAWFGAIQAAGYPIPEPASLALLAAGLGMSLRRPRKA